MKGEKRIGLSYSIQNFDSGKEMAVIRMLSDNVKYEILKLSAVMDPISATKKMIPSGTYAGRELLSIVEGMVEHNQFVVDDQVIKKNKLKGITEMILNLKLVVFDQKPHFTISLGYRSQEITSDLSSDFLPNFKTLILPLIIIRESY